MLWLPLLTLIFTSVSLLALAELHREQQAPVLRPVAPNIAEPVASATTNTSGAPLVSVIVPARNEAARIVPLLEGLAAQQERNFEVIIIDDQSSDGTSALVQGFADRIPGLQVIPGERLPEGWAGKCWACWQGVAHARGEWLLFLDADVAPQPALVGTLIAEGGRKAYDIITLMPFYPLHTLAEHVVMPIFYALMYDIYPLHRVGNGGRVMANGQVIFVARSVYAAAGGHAAVRNSVLEDVDLGRALVSAGGRILAAHAPVLCTVRMYTDWPTLAEGLGKNAVAGARSGGWRSVWVGLKLLFLATAPWHLIAGGIYHWQQEPGPFGAALFLHGIALFALTSGVWGTIGRWRYDHSRLWGGTFLFGLTCYFFVATMALLRIGTGRGVTWKGRLLDGRR